MSKHLNTRRAFLAGIASLSVYAPVAGPLLAADWPEILVEKTPGCGCCSAWAKLARDAGFTVRMTENDDYEGMKQAAGVPEDLWSCHTARVGDYVVEGHVPFAAIKALLRDRPDIVGLSVPGMPNEAPGMAGGLNAQVPVTAWGGTAGTGAAFAYTAD